jgi:hypothetical protein
VTGRVKLDTAPLSRRDTVGHHPLLDGSCGGRRRERCCPCSGTTAYIVRTPVVCYIASLPGFDTFDCILVKSITVTVAYGRYATLQQPPTPTNTDPPTVRYAHRTATTRHTRVYDIHGAPCGVRTELHYPGCGSDSYGTCYATPTVVCTVITHMSVPHALITYI